MPSEPRKESWDMLMLVLILYSMWMVPLRICFDEEATGCWLAFEILISIAFMLDVVITFNTVVYEATTGTWVLSRRQIAQRYLGGWFWIDAPASVPVELIDITIDRLSNSGDTGSLGALRMLRLFRLFRLLRLLKLGDYIEVLESAADMNLKFLKILLMKFQLIAIAHLLGCFWFSMYVLNSADPALTTWAETYDEGRAVKEGTSTSLKYMYSIYWAAITLTTVGYGDVVPVNDSERMYTIGAMLCAALVFGYMASGIGQVVGSMDRTRALADEKTSQIKEYLAWRNLPMKNSTFQMEVFALIRNVSYVKGEVVFKRGEPSRAIMFLSSGEVVVYSPASVSPLARITPDTEITLMHGNADMEVMRFKHEGCLAQIPHKSRARLVHMHGTDCDTRDL
ncbi:voltage-gated ion channel superfamily [Chrysochromulina tobinii]|uniref:Voltage-gated ion channel superfamily n=1 Tax=Chrysochromulina tobinii TaxID=1460289 RepID=A0A0M0JCU7_9EUKA|nr:voltage-gated ion channel superfamily [Chrysochromulina tobinii]|eukprot:KOO24404.1 voltage-gated ion channel superfamily [Chrysochromulina sp. CCMP291]